MNWGLLLPLALWGTIQMRDYRHPMVIGGWVLFALCNIIRFQPWNWDNSKLLTWSYLMLIIPVVRVLSYLWRTNRRPVQGGCDRFDRAADFLRWTGVDASGAKQPDNAPDVGIIKN